MDSQYFEYKVKVLVWDLYHFEDLDSSDRLNSACDQLCFISYPYFPFHEAEYIANAPTRVYQDRVGSSHIQSVRDALLEHLSAFHIDWRRRRVDIVGSTQPTPRDVAHIFLFVFGITFIQLGSVRFQHQLRKDGLRLVSTHDLKETAYEQLDNCATKIGQYNGVRLPKLTG